MAGIDAATTGEHANGTARGGKPTDYAGPTYRDVRALATDMERLSGRRIAFLIDAGHVDRRWEGAAMHIRCVARTREDFYRGACYGSAIFSGSAGAATLPGAMIQALHSVWERIEEGGMFPEETDPE